MILRNITNVKNEEIKISSVSFNKITYYKIIYDNKELGYIDIQLNSCKEKVQFHKFLKIPVSDDKTYYIETKEKTKELLELKIRPYKTNQNNNWHSKIQYVGINNFNQNWFEKYFFQKRKIAIPLTKKPDNILIKRLNLDPEYLNQKLKAEVEFIENYGWSIKLNYKSNSDLKVKLDYKFEDEKWITYCDLRDGKYNFTHIHGKEKFEKTSRNIKAGKYNLRLQYKDRNSESNYLTTTILIPDYVNN
jgi:hypothetical protein